MLFHEFNPLQSHKGTYMHPRVNLESRKNKYVFAMFLQNFKDIDNDMILS